MAISRFQTFLDLELGAIKIRAEANKLDKLAEAEGTRALVDADNAISEEIVAMKIQLARLQALPEIVAQMVKPAEKIESIKIHQVSGLGGKVGGSGNNAQVSEGTPRDTGRRRDWQHGLSTARP